MPLQFANSVAEKKSYHRAAKTSSCLLAQIIAMFKLRNQAMKYSPNPSSAIHHYQATVK